MPDSFEANSGFERARAVKGECRGSRIKATPVSVAAGVAKRSPQQGRFPVQVPADGGLEQTDSMPRFPHEEPPNKPLKRTKPAGIVLENRGSQQAPAFVYHRPPDDGFAA
jgi:hypothetical protein